MQRYLKSILAAFLAMAAVPAFGLMLNEVRTDQPGNPDDEEFVEIKGEPGESLDGVWFLYVGDHSGAGSFAGSGTIEIALNLSGYAIPDDGHFLMLGANFDGDAFGLAVEDVDYLFEGFGNALENSDNTTAMLVRNFNATGGAEIRGIDDQLGEAAIDIDDNDDGVPNEVLPWDEVIDAVGIFESETSGEFNYGAALGFTDAGPDGNFAPSHIYRTSDTEEWQVGAYDVFELDENDAVIGLNPDGFDTPGSENPLAPEETFEPSIETVSTIFADSGSTVEITGGNLDLVNDVTFGGVTAPFSYADEILTVTIPEGVEAGHIEVVNPDGTAASNSLIVVIDPASLILAETFAEELGSFSAFSVASDADWTASGFRDSTYIEANGFGADFDSDDWLVSPAVDLSGVSNPFLIMGHERVFGGPALEVKVSTDADAATAGPDATWTDLEVTLAGDDAGEIVHSGNVDLSAYAGGTVTIAIRYTSDGTGPGDGAIDRIHYVGVGGEVAAGGWVETAEYGWVYELGSGWVYSLDLGTFYKDTFPWIYQVNFGYLYHVAFIDGLGFWLYSADLQWIYLAQGAGGWFQAEANGWEYDNFIEPIVE